MNGIVKKSIILLVLVIFIYGCSPKYQIDNSTIEFDQIQFIDVSESSFLSDCQIIPLEGSSESYLGNRPGFKLFNNCFYVADYQDKM